MPDCAGSDRRTLGDHRDRARARPSMSCGPQPPATSGLCPFCPGQEDKTPREVYGPGRAPSAPPTSRRGGGCASCRTGSPRSRSRATSTVRRKDLRPDERRRRARGDHRDAAPRPADEGPLRRGAHRVPLFKARILDLRNDLRLPATSCSSKNEGQLAGASLDHAHSQLIALPVVPRQVVEEIEGGGAT